MNNSFRRVLLVAGLLAMHPCVHGREIPLIAGNLIECTISEPNFSGRTAKVGDPLVCYARPLREFGCSGFPRGTQLAGRLVGYRDPGRFWGKGWIKLEFDRLILPTAEASVAAKVVSIEGFKVDREGRILGRGHPRRDAIGWMLPILWPVKILTLPLRGPVPALKGERSITLRLLSDLTVPCEGLRASSAESRWRRFGSSSESFLGSPSATSKRYGVWRTFDGREVERAENPARSSQGAVANLGSESRSSEPSPEESAMLRPDGEALDSSRAGDALVIESGQRTLTIGSSWPSRLAAKSAP